MKRVILSLLLAVVMVVSAGNAIAQEEAPANIARVIEVRAIPGHTAKFEAGVKEYSAWAAENGYSWSWSTWEVITGENTGSYLVATFNHSWADFDHPPIDMAANETALAKHIYPHVASANVSFWALRPGVTESTHSTRMKGSSTSDALLEKA